MYWYTTFKTNCFGMPLLDIICINNLGKSCTMFVALLSNSKYTSFRWTLSEFQKNLKVKPKVIFSDEEEALRKSNWLMLSWMIILGLKEIFPKSIINLCAWHIEQKLKKKVVYLNKGNNKKSKTLFKTIINIPYSEYEDKYQKSY